MKPKQEVKLVENLELAVAEPSRKFAQGFDPKSLEHAYNFDDYDDVVVAEPPQLDLAVHNLLTVQPEPQVKTDFQKMVFSGVKFMSDVVPNVPKSLFTYAPEIGNS